MTDRHVRLFATWQDDPHAPAFASEGALDSLSDFIALYLKPEVAGRIQDRLPEERHQRGRERQIAPLEAAAEAKGQNLSFTHTAFGNERTAGPVRS